MATPITFTCNHVMDRYHVGRLPFEPERITIWPATEPDIASTAMNPRRRRRFLGVRRPGKHRDTRGTGSLHLPLSTGRRRFSGSAPSVRGIQVEIYSTETELDEQVDLEIADSPGSGRTAGNASTTANFLQIKSPLPSGANADVDAAVGVDNPFRPEGDPR